MRNDPLFKKILNSDSGIFSHLWTWRNEEHGILAATPKSAELFETSLFAFFPTGVKKKYNLHTKITNIKMFVFS